MKKEKKLVIERGIFAFFIFVIFGVIVVTEKFGNLKTPRIENKMNAYIKDSIQSLEEVTKEKITYNDSVYKMKITSNQNKNLYFYITYDGTKLKDTYQEDYVEGKSLLTKIKKDMEIEIEKRNNTTQEIEILSTLNKYTSKVQEQIIKEENLLQLKFYSLKRELLISDWNSKEIINKMTTAINKYTEKGITPKYYSFIITNKNKIKESIQINNITEEFINNKDQIEIINDIINDKETKLLKQYKITYKYLD